MNNIATRLTVPMDKGLRTKLGKRADDLGFDSAQALLRYVSKALVDGRKISFGDEEWDDWGPVPDRVMERWRKELTRHEADRKAGKVKNFGNPEDALKYLHLQ